MKPTVIEYSHAGKRCAFLVDTDSVFTAPDRETGRPCLHYAGAVDFGETRGGILHVGADGKHLLYPRPCLHAVIGKTEANTLEWLGIDDRSAAAMLRLARAGCAVSVDFAADEWSFAGPRGKRCAIAWNGWRWLAAWRWNWWQDHGMTGPERLAEMRAFGYTETAGAFRQMLSRMGLVTSRAR